MHETRTVKSSDGVEIAWTDHGGSGEPTLFLHGITECSEVWRPILDRLSDRRVITMDLRGHGASGPAEHYDIASMAGDAVSVLEAAGTLGSTHLVGHSLGAMLATAVGAAVPTASVVNVDQSLRMGEFLGQLAALEAGLRDAERFAATMAGHFDELAGPLLSSVERERVQALRRKDQQVVLGIWELSFASSEAELNAVVEGALAGYEGSSTPYLTVFGNPPEPGYDAWLERLIPRSRSQLWPEHGHHPHLVDPDRFVDTLRAFWR